jgi:hypothetical protein
VGTDLCLNEAPIAALPEGLRVGGHLDLRDSGIRALPSDLMAMGDVSLAGTGLATLPEGLTVGGSLHLHGTGIEALPRRLTVGGWLDLDYCDCWNGQVPEGTRVGQRLITTAHPNGLTLPEWRRTYPAGEPVGERGD